MTNTCAMSATHGIVYGDEGGYPLSPLVDTLRNGDPQRCNVRLASVPPPHDRCLSADWPNHHHVFGALP